ncbi:MAG: CehA/McbA family metallohydrolase [Candidatus Hydrogenedens sp.]|nr:CehA/McbA family metallohydrolase [Candidatus Hydrogenedentota bacterium]NLF56826.1 CehA/McbA family metallohydrolase [Candidatus Hydrogenedens sp.]
MKTRGLCLALVALLAGCAGTGTGRGVSGPVDAETPKARAAEPAPPAVDLEVRPKGALYVMLRNVVGQALEGRVDLRSLEGGATRTVEVAGGSWSGPQPQGEYRAYVHILEREVPVLAEIRDVTVRAGEETVLAVNLLEGASGAVPLRAFDSDGDLAIDRVELAAGTDPYNAASMPGRPELNWDTRVLRGGPQWFRGELHAYSEHGGGRETVAQLVARAERAGLDFLAIADRNTLAAARDPGFRSDRLALIPAMEWGADGQGVALVYGPLTEPDPPTTISAAQAECIRVQAQGGVWAVAHPCFPTKPWQWGLSYVNAVEVWFRDWRGTPPMSLNNLREEIKVRKDGALVHSIAAAAGMAGLDQVSANAQSSQFWDYELNRGLMASAIAGSGSGNKDLPLGRPVTYIHAAELSLPALLDGLRMGRTYVSCDLNGPQLGFCADVLGDGKVDVGMGGVVPLNVETVFDAAVLNALGKKLQVLENGRPIRTVPINDNNTAIRFRRKPTTYSTYRLRVIGPADPKAKGFGPIEVYAVSSPIYAQDITQELLWRNPNLDPDKTWVRIQSEDVMEVELPENVPPMTAPAW